MSVRKFDLITGSFLVLVSLVVFSASLKMLLATVKSGRDWYTSAGLFPATIAVVLLGLSIQLILTALRAGAMEDMKSQRLPIILKSPDLRALAGVTVLTLVYVMAMNHISYIMVTAIYLFILLLAGTRKIFPSLALSFVGSWAIAMTFERLAYIPLP